MGGLQAKSMTSQRYRATYKMADMRYYGNVMTTTRWRLYVILHLQQYSRRRKLFWGGTVNRCHNDSHLNFLCHRRPMTSSFGASATEPVPSNLSLMRKVVRHVGGGVLNASTHAVPTRSEFSVFQYGFKIHFLCSILKFPAIIQNTCKEKKISVYLLLGHPVEAGVAI